jgi:hypothetical protein
LFRFGSGILDRPDTSNGKRCFVEFITIPPNCWLHYDGFVTAMRIDSEFVQDTGREGGRSWQIEAGGAANFPKKNNPVRIPAVQGETSDLTLTETLLHVGSWLSIVPYVGIVGTAATAVAATLTLLDTDVTFYSIPTGAFKKRSLKFDSFGDYELDGVAAIIQDDGAARFGIIFDGKQQDTTMVTVNMRCTLVPFSRNHDTYTP